MTGAVVERGSTTLVARVATSPVLWVAGAVCLLASPALFASTVVLGVLALLAGISVHLRTGRVWVLALGIGMVAGSAPYTIAALVAAAR